jgi:hypothetical protein
MAEPRFANEDDDLPRTFRREREAREREAREREREAGPSFAAQCTSSGMSGDFGSTSGYGAVPPATPDPHYALPAFDGTVKRFEVPFVHLVGFFLKCALAAIPALLLMTLLMFAGGKALQAIAPEFRLFEIVVRPTATLPDSPVVAPLVPSTKQPTKK